MIRIYISILFVAVLYLYLTATEIKEVSLIPREELFGFGMIKTYPQISPDGKKLAYLAPLETGNNVLNIWVKTIGKDDARPLTQENNQSIWNFFWQKKQDDPYIIFLKDNNGDENDHIYKIDVETLQCTDLTPFPGSKVTVVHINKNFPDEILIRTNKDNPIFFDAYRLNLIDGTLKRVAQSSKELNVREWIADSNLDVRVAQKTNEDGSQTILIRENAQEEFKPLFTWGLEDVTWSDIEKTSHVISFSKNGKYLYLSDSRQRNTTALVKINLTTLQKNTLCEDEEYDLHNVIMHPDTYEPIAASFIKERCEWKVLNHDYAQDFENISKIDKGDWSLVNTDNMFEKWIIAFTCDDKSPAYYLYDTKTKQANFIFYARPNFFKYKFAQTNPISFKSHDGLTLHGYITCPVNKEKKNLPLILLVHGGPESRDTWTNNRVAQWLANRGYACLQVNYRGSIGYGKKFMQASFKQFGHNMHNDLVDAINWAIDQNIADPKKIAIYGASYGGYAALVGATFTPDIFCCAVDCCGPSNLITVLRAIPPFWQSVKTSMFAKIGNPDTEEEFLKSCSPLFKVDQIKIPILIAQGANDPRIKQEESEQIVEALKSKELKYQYLLFPDEGHGFVKHKNKMTFYSAAEKFLAENLDGRYES